MLGIQFIKANPTSYVLHFKNGRIKREGPGLSFWYYAPNSTIVSVPISTVDVPFVFEEVSSDFQSIVLQGQMTYRVTDARRLAELMDFSVNSSGRYLSRDPEKLNDRLIAHTQVLSSAVMHRMNLKEAIVSQDQISAEVFAALRESETIRMLGVEVLSLSILRVSPTPEVAKALEAEAREQLQQKSDEAIYARRNAAVEQERRIKESELNTEIAIEEKKRTKRETQIAADIAIEERRKALIEQQADNERKRADTKAYGMEAMLKPVRELDWKVLMALSAGGTDARNNVALAFRELAENAEKIGNLNISPELLETLLYNDSPKK